MSDVRALRRAILCGKQGEGMNENELMSSSARAFLARMLKSQHRSGSKSRRHIDESADVGDVHVVKNDDLDRTLSLSDPELE